MRNFLNILCVTVLAATFLAGCSYIKELKLPLITTEGKDVSAEHQADADTAESPKPVYPEKAKIAEPYDIEIVRDGNAIVLDNRTINSYDNAWLWLNRQYGAKIDSIPVGRGEPLSLESFINEHGEPYPVARFLKPDRDRPLVLGDLEVNGTIHKLTVRLEENWRHP